MGPLNTRPATFSESDRVARLEPPAAPPRLVLDSDAANQSDDLFAIAYALLAPDRLRVEALYAAPFGNGRALSPADGMARSFAEIGRVVERLNPPHPPPVHRGADAFLPSAGAPVVGDAARDLVRRALDGDPADPLYVAAIAAPTNVASAILLEPAVTKRIVVVWLGGQPHDHPDVTDFNARQDRHATRVLFDSGVPLVQIPCAGVAELLSTSVPELERHVEPCGAVGAYLTARVAAEWDDPRTRAKILWDLAPIAWLIHPAWVPTVLASSPILNDSLTWSRDPRRHFIRVATRCERDPIFRDLFARLRAAAAGQAG